MELREKARRSGRQGGGRRRGRWMNKGDLNGRGGGGKEKGLRRSSACAKQPERREGDGNEQIMKTMGK
jgi:hypothetical protein